MANFDRLIKRTNTNSVKYDGLEQYFGVKDAQPLWVADMDFAAPKFVQKALKSKIDQEAFGYEITSENFYTSIIHWQKRFDLDLKKENILFTAGVVPSLAAAIRCFSDEDDEVIIQPPVYFPFFSVIKQNNRKTLLNPLSMINGKYTIDFDHLQQLITPKTKLLILCSPHNPVGRVWKKKELQKLHAICKKNNIMVISDEIHADIVFKKFTSYATIDKKALVFNAPSKTFNVAGFNSSYAFSLDAKVLESFKNEVQRSHLNSLNSISNTLIETCYSKKGEKWLKELLEYLKKNIYFVQKYLQQNLPNIKVIKTEATYLLWLDFKNTGLTHSQIRKKLFHKAKVVLNDGLTFGKNGQYFFRMNIALPKSELKIALQKIKNEFG